MKEDLTYCNKRFWKIIDKSKLNNKEKEIAASYFPNEIYNVTASTGSKDKTII